jgi:hypothetical protein
MSYYFFVVVVVATAAAATAAVDVVVMRLAQMECYFVRELFQDRACASVLAKINTSVRYVPFTWRIVDVKNNQLKTVK